MKPSFDVVIVIPIGPGSLPGFIIDTIESYVYFTRGTYSIILADDSHQGVGKEVKKVFPEVTVLATDKPLGGWAGLYISLAHSFKYALDRFDFKVVLKLDTDALIIGPEPEAAALQLFTTDEKVAIAGQYPNDYHGKMWDRGWPRQRIYNGTQTWKFIRRPLSNLALIPLAKAARANGYENGESVFGGAYFMGANFLRAMEKAGHLPNYKLSKLNLGEDHIFGLLAKAIGYKLCGLCGKDEPFGLAWKGLPVSPEQLLADNKKIIHSVKGWQKMNEAEIRLLFRQKRETPITFAQPGLG